MKNQTIAIFPKMLIIIMLTIGFFACKVKKDITKSPNITKPSTTTMEEITIKPPIARKIPKSMTVHGDTRIDNYYWMNDRENQEVIDWLNGENAYTESELEHTQKFQKDLFDEIVGRIKKDDESVPYKDNGYWYIRRFEKGSEYPIYSRKKGSMENKEEIMLNVNELAKGIDYFAARSLRVSDDNKIMAFGEDTLSRRIYTIKFKNLETGEMLDDVIPNTTGSAVWAADNKTVFYSIKDEALRSYKIFRHTLGTPASEDAEVFHEADETFGTYIYRTKSKKWLVIGSYSTLSSEYQILKADDPYGSFKIFQSRERKLEYDISHYGDKFYVRTNLDAKNFRLMSCPETKTTKDNWTEVIAHRDDILLEGVEIFKEYLVVEERIKGIRNMRIRPWDGSAEHYVDFGEDAFLLYPSVNPEFDTDIIRIGYTSMTTPNSQFDYNMKTKDIKLLKEQEVLGDFDKTNYKGERIYVTARDGVQVPVSIVYKKTTAIDGTAPMLLYAYGSYGSSMDPYFSSVRLSLLDRGFVFAIAHVRGGEELGRQWYENGKLLNKKNTFYDFIDCADKLVDKKYSAPDKVFAMGGSAGGLLMGAIINYRPERWRGVVAAVPFVDVVTTMLDESIPLTTGEFDEWGNPKEEEYYHYIKSYSPYDNVEAKAYPNMLVTTGLHDSQVQYWEPAKWVAKLRELKTDDNVLLMKTNMDAGHGGQSGRFRRYHETALEYAFIFDLIGIKE